MSKFRGAGKWRSEGPARTNTGSSIRGKISAPIPFPEDDEFPIRTPGAGIATSLGSDGMETRLRASIAAELDNTALQTGIPMSNAVDPKLPMQSAAGPPQPLPEAQIRRTNQPSVLRNSGTSVPSGSSVGKPQRKKSSFRSALGRLFGKKSKNGGDTGSQEEGASGVRAGQHRSDPTALNRTPTGAGSQKRSASLPINEYNRALRSHSTATEDFPNADEETNLEFIHADGQRRPRRATTPSRLWTPTKAPGGWTGLSPRPASSHARGSRVIVETEAEAATGIGIAVSGSHPKRRSRSLGEMREAAAAHTIARRRSDEIRYWRESYDPGILSPMSSNKAEAEEPIVLDEPEEAQDEDPEEQPQPFNFGPLGEMAGMKITHAASLDTRVCRLEESMLKIERVLYRGQNYTTANPIQDRSSSIPRPTTDNSEMSLPKHQRHREPQARHQTHESRPQGSQIRSSSYGSSRPSTMSTHISYHPNFDTFSPPPIPSSEPPLDSSQNTARPLSTSTTIRGIPSSSPTLPKDGNFTAEHYTALTSMIHAEQAARHQLEAVVHSLQQQLHALRPSGSISYPTPGSDHPTNVLRGGSAAGGEFSSFEQDDSSDDEGRYPQEDFQTPNEAKGNFGDEIFGDVRDHGDAKSAPRTLSLSQITLGKGAQHSLNF